MPKLIDLSHTIEDGLITYKGLPAPIICDFLSREASKNVYADGATFQIGKIEMCSNTGTYLDTPFHRYADGKDLAQIELAALADLEGVRVSVPPGQNTIGPEVFAGLDLRGKAVLVHTDWARHWNTEQYFEGNPHLNQAAAEYLLEAGVRLVGIDSLNIDSTAGKARPVHTILLGAEILIVEHMCNLEQVPANGFRFYAVPVKVKGMGTFPVRAFAKIES